MQNGSEITTVRSNSYVDIGNYYNQSWRRFKNSCFDCSLCNFYIHCVM